MQTDPPQTLELVNVPETSQLTTLQVQCFQVRQRIKHTFLHRLNVAVGGQEAGEAFEVGKHFESDVAQKHLAEVEPAEVVVGRKRDEDIFKGALVDQTPGEREGGEGGEVEESVLFDEHETAVA